MLHPDRLRALRLQKNFTSEYLAEQLSLSTRQIARYEAGEADPASSVVTKMADIFDVSTDYLLGRTNDPTPQSKRDNLTSKEHFVLAALRRNDPLTAIRAIVDDVESRN
jgi:transcriptional regulator with XRE-family HTH domain